MTWSTLATYFPEYMQWVVQTYGPLPEGPIDQGEYELYRLAYEDHLRTTVGLDVRPS